MPNALGLLVGLFLIAVGTGTIWLRHRIAQNLPVVIAKPSFRNFPRKDSPKSVAAMGCVFIIPGLILIAIYINSIS